jgi:aminoglycoside phosphotransferase (APT) family kinase protein
MEDVPTEEAGLLAVAAALGSRSVAVRLGSGPGSGDAIERTARVMRGLAAAGLPVPVASTVHAPDATYLVTPWIEGVTGAAWLDDPERAARLGEVMGAMARRLRLASPSVVAADGASAGSRELALVATAHLGRAGAGLGATTVAAIEGAIKWLAATDRWRPVVVHGDFAPVNVIVGPDGEILALVDFEHARLGSPMADVAWWGWVVRHHHPDAWRAAWPTFRAAAGVPSGDPADAEIRAVMLVRLLESVAAADESADPERRRVWARRLDEAAAWA